MEPEIIYEDENMLVVNKPSGLAVHSENSDPAGTLVEWFLRREPSARGVGETRLGRNGEEIERSGIVHRLDRDTSGVMVLVKNQETFYHFKAQFRERLAKKEYRALVYGKMKDRWGTIDRPIGRSASDFRLRSSEKGARGLRRDAITDWESLKVGEYEGESFSYIKAKPKTGRMHQIRVHLKAISRPIVGDKLYAEHLIDDSNNLGVSRLALHSHRLIVTLPDGQVREFEAPVPAELVAAIERIAE